MCRKFKVWLDSGANIHSKRELVVTLDQIGYTDEEWDNLSDDERENEMREIAWGRADWGYHEVTD